MKNKKKKALQTKSAKKEYRSEGENAQFVQEKRTGMKDRISDQGKR